MQINDGKCGTEKDRNHSIPRLFSSLNFANPLRSTVLQTIRVSVMEYSESASEPQKRPDHWCNATKIEQHRHGQFCPYMVSFSFQPQSFLQIVVYSLNKKLSKSIQQVPDCG